MTEKKGSDQLGRDDLKEVKGGIPYETPALFELSLAQTSCAVGNHCDSGHNCPASCTTGTTCSTGTHGPNPDIKPA